MACHHAEIFRSAANCIDRTMGLETRSVRIVPVTVHHQCGQRTLHDCLVDNWPGSGGSAGSLLHERGFARGCIGIRVRGLVAGRGGRAAESRGRGCSHSLDCSYRGTLVPSWYETADRRETLRSSISSLIECVAPALHAGLKGKVVVNQLLLGDRQLLG